MLVANSAMRSIWLEPDGGRVGIIDRRGCRMLVDVGSERSPEAAHAIKAMQVRGAPLIGAAAAYGMALAKRGDPRDAGLDHACRLLLATRPTAVNLRWAIEEMRRCLPRSRRASAWPPLIARPRRMRRGCRDHRGIAAAGQTLSNRPDEAKQPAVVNVLTHCNAGWLATVDWGTATGADLPRP